MSTAEIVIVEDPLEDRLVVVHAPDDGPDEAVVEDEAEVLERVALGLGYDLRVGDSGLPELVRGAGRVR